MHNLYSWNINTAVYAFSLRRKHEPSYSDVPFFGLRTMYHIVRKRIVIEPLVIPRTNHNACNPESK